MVELNNYSLSVPYGLFVFSSGAWGWISNGSMISFISGGTIGFLLIIFGILGYIDWSQHPRPALIYVLCLTLLSTMLTVVMWFRFFKTNHFFPAGALGSLATMFTLFYISDILLRPKKKIN